MKFSELRKDVDKIKELKIDTYLPLAEKMYILLGTEENSGMVNSILSEENGLWYIDRFKYQMYLVYNIIIFYGNIVVDVEFDNEVYDWIMKNEVFDFIVGKANEDYYRFVDLLDDLLRDELEKRNSIVSVAIRYLDKFMIKLDEISNPEKLKQLGETFKEITDKNPVLLELLENDFKTRSGKKKKVK